MSYIICYKRLSENDSENQNTYTETVSNKQYELIKSIPWIKIISYKKVSETSDCSSLQ